MWGQQATKKPIIMSVPMNSEEASRATSHRLSQDTTMQLRNNNNNEKTNNSYQPLTIKDQNANGNIAAGSNSRLESRINNNGATTTSTTSPAIRGSKSLNNLSSNNNDTSPGTSAGKTKDVVSPRTTAEKVGAHYVSS